MNLEPVSEEIRRRFDLKMAAREKALPASRKAIRSSANAIRATHRGEAEKASQLMAEAGAAIREAVEAVRDHPDVTHAGFIQDAQKEYAEARITEALVAGRELPGPDDIGVEVAPYLNGMAEAVGEARRQILDLLRRGEVGRSEMLLQAMDDIYFVLASMDYPDAITGNLRRSTDVARSIMERTRGDLSLSLVNRDLRDALERHAREVTGRPEGT
jgi:translin